MLSNEFDFPIRPDENGVCRVVIPLRREPKWEPDGVIETRVHGTVFVPVNSHQLDDGDYTIEWTCGVPFQVLSGPADPELKELNELLTSPLPTESDDYVPEGGSLIRTVRQFDWKVGEAEFYKCTFRVKINDDLTDEWDPHVVGHRYR